MCRFTARKHRTAIYGMATTLSKSLAIVIVVGALTATGQPKQGAGVYTSGQSTAGRAAYRENCSTCHGPELAGRNEAPQLAGNNFMSACGGRGIRDLTSYIQTTMPPGAAGSLTQKMSVDISAFLLESNGAAAGNQPLTPATSILIRSVATGRLPRDAAAGGGLGRGVFPVNLAPAPA